MRAVNIGIPADRRHRARIDVDDNSNWQQPTPTNTNRRSDVIKNFFGRASHLAVLPLGAVVSYDLLGGLAGAATHH